ncbi:hypothetical protein F5Y15DRAFT_374540 [Xylariaceae sp. FL0016]|nr:hypothetical protein F5Y15DRAFT_374540 [Xylariaceae sp. FL0016]
MVSTRAQHSKSTPAPGEMASSEHIEALREQVTRAIVDQLSDTNFDWSSFEQLTDPVLCVEATFQDRSKNNAQRRSPSGLAVSQIVDLTGVRSPKAGTPCASPDYTMAGAMSSVNQVVAESSGKIIPSPQGSAQLVPQDAFTEQMNADLDALFASDVEDSSPEVDVGDNSRSAISSLRPSRGGITIAEDNTQRQMQISNGNYTKRRKAEPVGYALKPSTLDKLIVGIWEQIHGGINIDPQELLGQFMTTPLLQGAPGDSSETISLGLIQPNGGSVFQPGRPFNDTNIFCRKVTQASRTCRSIEVIVQGRWVEHFDAYVNHLKMANPSISETKHRKAVLIEACNDFGWTEKELRNKMAVWRGYKEIKDAGGWAALIFAGMGIYRFCKYRIGFDSDSIQRLRNLRPALEVAADTMHPNWRQLLAIVGESTDRIYHGHTHNWVVCLDGSSPVPLHTTYLQWDPFFSFRHIEECLVDEQAWGCDDPRWSPPTDVLTRVSSLAICDCCGKEQSDDARLNNCYCFPSLFGSAKVTPSPVMVFCTSNGRSNGLMALCPFERGAAIGEFVGIVTRGLQDVDVMESTSGSTKYQIWQGQQGNFTRFVNHSCVANAQYQRFTWLDTQRIILVSKGIGAGEEITVDYSDKYWKGLDKNCLCGEKSCRYRKIHN